MGKGIMPNISYFKRDFRSIREELVNFIKQNYPDTISTFNDGGVGSLLIDLIAACSDSLSYNIDRAAQENLIDYAQERGSLFNLARTYGVKIPFKRPSVTLCDFTVTVPAKGNAPDVAYLPLIVRGAQVLGGSVVFETTTDIDFLSPFSSGLPNRTITPNYSSAGTITTYDVTKREIVVSGRSKVFKKVITANDSRPNMSLFLPDADVLNVTDLIVLDGTSSQTSPSLSEWYTDLNRWYEVPSLVQGEIFVEMPQETSDDVSVIIGKWKSVDRKFTTEYTDKGFFKISFGGGEVEVNKNLDGYISDASLFMASLDKKVNMGALGIYPQANRTMFVRYRVGGGVNSNIGAGTISSVGSLNMVVTGSNPTINGQVRSSLVVNNPVPAFGGRNEPSIEEIRQMIKYNYSAQSRCVTDGDYMSRIALIPGQYGAPYKFSVRNKDGFVEISIIGIGADGKLTNQSTNALKQNISTYLSNFKSPTDYLVIKDGKVINVSFEFDLFIDKNYDSADIASTVIDNVYDYMSVATREMGENVHLSNLIETVNNVAGVVNVIDMRVYDKVGGQYSLNAISQSYLNETTKQIDLLGKNVLLAGNDDMFEVKYKDRDIRVRFTQ
jgi:hypothetical protein